MIVEARRAGTHVKLRLFRLFCPVRRGRLVRRRHGTRGWRAAGQPFNRRTHGIPVSSFADGIEKRSGRAGAAYQRLRVRKHNRVIPRALDNKRKLERSGIWLGRGNEGGRTLEIEFACRNRGCSRQRQFHGRAINGHVVNSDGSLRNFQRNRDFAVRRPPAAKFAAARKWPTLEASQQLLNVEARERTVCSYQIGGAIQGPCHRKNAVTTAFDRKRDISFALEATQAEQLAEATLEIDVRELQLRLDINALIEFGKRHRAFNYAAICLRLADRNDQTTAAQISGYRGTAELGIRYDNICGGQSQIKIETCQTV